jgi:hypothetical protein
MNNISVKNLNFILFHSNLILNETYDIFIQQL